MKDKFEKFMQTNREVFDIYEPSDNVWEGIEKNIRRRSNGKIHWRIVLTRVAAALIIFVASYYFHDWYNSHDRETVMAEADKTNNIPELQEIENYYEGVIDDKLDEIEPMLTQYPGLDEEINRDLGRLDSIYIDLKKDLKDNIANREVIEAMIENYRLRVQILEDLLGMLDPENEKPKQDNHEI